MKNIIICILFLFVLSVIGQAQPATYSPGHFTVKKKLLVGDSLRVGKTAIFNGAVTMNGGQTVTGKQVVSDSLRVGSTSTLNGAVTVNSNVLVKVPVAGNAYPFRATKPTGGSNVFTVDTSGNQTIAGTLGIGGLLTLDEAGGLLALHTIAAGDSVFGHFFLDAADTVLKAWNGTAWVTIVDIAP